MPQVSRSTFATNLATVINDNTAKDVTPAEVRSVFTDLEDSAIWFDEGPRPQWVTGLASFTPVLTDTLAAIDDPGGTPVWGELTFQQVMDMFNTASIGTTVQAFDADTLKSDTSRNLTAGYTTTAFSLGSITSGTTTPAFANGNIQTLTNNGAFTLAPPTGGTGTMVIEITNGSTPGVVTTSGFNSRTGDVFTTTVGHRFLLSIAVVGARSYLNVSAASDNP